MSINCYSLDLKHKIIHFYNNLNYSIKNIVLLFKVSKSSVYNWINLNKNNLLTKKNKYIKSNSILYNTLIHSLIVKYINLNSNFINKHLINYIYIHSGYLIKLSNLYNIIHYLKFTKKIVSFKKFYGNSTNNLIKLN